MFDFDLSAVLRCRLRGWRSLLLRDSKVGILSAFPVSLDVADLRDLDDSVDFAYNRSKIDAELRGCVWSGRVVISCN